MFIQNKLYKYSITRMSLPIYVQIIIIVDVKLFSLDARHTWDMAEGRLAKDTNSTKTGRNRN